MTRSHQSRATRFPLRLPLQYRGGGTNWCHATTENISRTGVLFRSTHPLAVGDRLEMQIEFGRGLIRSALRCQGAVVRLTDAGDGLPNSLVGVTMACYRIVRAPAPKSATR